MRKEPRRGQMATCLQSEGTSDLKSGKPRRRRQPRLQPRPPSKCGGLCPRVGRGDWQGLRRPAPQPAPLPVTQDKVTAT